MTGWGEKYEPFPTGLSVEQIKVFYTAIVLSRYLHYSTASILRDGFVGGIESDSEEISVKGPCHSTWLQFMKKYGKTEGTL